MPQREAIVCMSQVLSALNYAHELGVMHREVSPANILLASDGTVKLTGFGMAKSSADPSVTQVGTVMGWLEYMSPEQVTAPATVDGRTDIYSAGAVLYEMVTGQVPFVGKNQFDLMMAHVNTQPQVPAGVDANLAHILLTALAKDPAERFQTARQFRDAIESVSGVSGMPSAGAAEPIPDAPPPAEKWGLQKLVFTGLVTFLVMLAIFFTFFKISKL
jgi:serine/threonine-protein kinase